MKKITLFAAAAVIASSAMAVEPMQVKQFTPQVSVRGQLTKAPLLKRATAEVLAVSRADEEVAAAQHPTYAFKPGYYIGMTRDLKIYNPTLAFTAGKGVATFQSLVEAESYRWDWINYISTTEEEALSSTEKDLSFTIQATDEISFPEYTTTSLGVSQKYAINSKYLTFGGGPSTFNNLKDDEGNNMILAPVSIVGQNGGTWEATINYTDPENYVSETGTLEGLVEDIFNGTDVVSGKLTGYGAILRGAATPFRLSAVYLLAFSDAEQAIPVEVTVYAINQAGQITDSVLGRGESVIPEGESFATLDFEVESVNELNLPTGAPVIVPTTGAYVSITGMNVPALKEFAPQYNMGVIFPRNADEATSEQYQPAYPSNARLEFETVDKDGKESLYFVNTGGWGYLDNSDPNNYIAARDFYVAYDIVFPYIRNFTEGFDANDFTLTLQDVSTSEGDFAYGNRYYFADSDIMQFYTDEYVTIEVEGDWFECNIEAEEDQPRILSVEVAADPLPEGVEGRSGKIVFTGMGYDYAINVIQGEVANIKDVVAAKAKNGKVYDLQGRVVKNATKGIFIVDGKKVIL